MAHGTVVITGERNVTRMLQRAGRATSRIVVMPALDKGAAIVEADAKIRVPKESRRLMGSIDREPVGNQVAVKVFTKDPYAKRIERGFYGKDSLGRHYHQQGQPYMKPALNENRDRIVKIIMGDIRANLRRAGR